LDKGTEELIENTLDAVVDTTRRWTSADLELLPDDGNRYEIIDGSLFVAKQPHWHHQFACSQLIRFLGEWNDHTGAGVANLAPGLVFGQHDDVAPDVVWISNERLAMALDTKGHLRAAPELVVEVLSPGKVNERRDREAKLDLYSRRDVQEYWIIDWRQRTVEIYRREQTTLVFIERIYEHDQLSTPLLPGFAMQVGPLFAR
jgi:Uma2 family endonuclease